MPDVRMTVTQYNSIRSRLATGTASQKRMAAAMATGAGWARVDITAAPTAASWPAYVPPAPEPPMPPAPAPYSDASVFEDGGYYG